MLGVRLRQHPDLKRSNGSSANSTVRLLRLTREVFRNAVRRIVSVSQVFNRRLLGKVNSLEKMIVCVFNIEV